MGALPFLSGGAASALPFPVYCFLLFSSDFSLAHWRCSGERLQTRRSTNVTFILQQQQHLLEMLWSPPRPTESDSEAGPSNLRFKKPFLHWASLIAPSLGFHDSSVGKESACYAGDPGSIPRLGKIPGEGIGYPFQYSGLENSMDYIIRHD